MLLPDANRATTNDAQRQACTRPASEAQRGSGASRVGRRFENAGLSVHIVYSDIPSNAITIFQVFLAVVPLQKVFFA
jgi:hypothetical protein